MLIIQMTLILPLDIGTCPSDHLPVAALFHLHPAPALSSEARALFLGRITEHHTALAALRQEIADMEGEKEGGGVTHTQTNAHADTHTHTHTHTHTQVIVRVTAHERL
jgi:hypothetical protein